MAGRLNTNEQVAQRREAIRKVLASGRWSTLAAQAIADKFGVSLQQVADIDRRKVLDEIRASMEGDELNDRRAEFFARLDEVYAQSVAAKDRTNALKALSIASKALGIETKRVEHSGSVGVDVSAKHVDEAVRRLLEGG